MITRSWPKGLQIHPGNDPLLELPDSHPAKQVVVAHAMCRLNCVGKEIEWPGREHDAFDQVWHSELIQRKFSFSSYAYTFISFDLILVEWISRPSQVTKREVLLLSALPVHELLLDECESAATRDNNHKTLEALRPIREFNDLRYESIELRIKTDRLERPLPRDGSPIELLGLQFPGG